MTLRERINRIVKLLGLPILLVGGYSLLYQMGNHQNGELPAMFNTPLLEKESQTPASIFARLDKCLADVENETSCEGGFTDWFYPQLQMARQNGASKKDIDLRLDQVLVLAKQGKYWSTYVETLEKEGHGGLEEYIESLKK